MFEPRLDDAPPVPTMLAEATRHDMNLGELISYLEKLRPDVRFRQGLCNPHSYRGDYNELAFEPLGSTAPRGLFEGGCYLPRPGYLNGGYTAGEILAMARQCVSAEFRGYKGGNYVMTPETPLHIACYGEQGRALLPEFFVLDFKLGDNKVQPALSGVLAPPPSPRCPACNGDLGGFHLGRLEEHKPGCPRFPL